jgi:NADPH2 dehydrogenase
MSAADITLESSVLFQPLKIGNITTRHRIVMAPLTRFRAEDNHIPGPLAKEYYSQRPSVSGTLLFIEAIQISPRAGGLSNIPGIWSNAQIAAWKDIVAGVHEKGSFIFAQLYAAGRSASKEELA